MKILLLITTCLLLASCSMTECNDVDDTCGWIEEVTIGYNVYFGDDIIKLDIK